MFFRREKPRATTFEERLDALRRAGFHVDPEPGGTGRQVRVSRDGCAAVVAEGPEGSAEVRSRAGLLVNGDIAALVDAGFQKFFLTHNGLRKPALAPELRAIHGFQEDLREALGLKSLYNESMGTVSDLYQYDRVEDRDRGVPQRAWEI
jgi:hypothetical protein